MRKKKNKKSLTLYSLFGKIGDILFFPIIIIALLSSLSMLSAGKKSKPVAVFGYSLVNIKSGSMIDMGFGIGDTVITKLANKDSIALGDIIAFYNFHDPIDNNTEKSVIIEYNYESGKELDVSPENINPEGATTADFSEIVKIQRSNEKTPEYAEELGVDVYFHQVIGIYVDDWGNIFYKTKGSNNAYHDGYTREDFVVGKYINTPRFLRDIMNFCASGLGMIILVCVPLSALVLMDCFSLIEQIELIKYESSLVSGEAKLTDSDFKKNFDPYDMDLWNKVYIYYKTAPPDREKVKNMIWRELYDPDNELNSKEKNELALINKSIEKLEVSPEEYWRVWLLETKGRLNKKIQKHYNTLEYEKLYNKIVTK